MLAPDHRHVLLDLLRPPPGYVLDGAVGTTFTLGLETALVVPLAFASFRLSTTSDPIAVMEAVRAASEKVDLFCQAGQISVPRQATGLFAFLEPMVHDVRRPPGHLFHPKVWFLRYVAEDEPPAVRLLCLTRNLTDDASWDVALRLDGSEESRPKAANRPLADFLLALPAMTVQELDPARVARIEALAQSARRAEWEGPDDVNQPPVFWPLGLPGRSLTPDFSGYRHLVVAPFMNAEGLDVVAPSPASEVSVVSRVEDLDQLATDIVDTLAETLVVSAAADLDDPEAPTEELTDRDRLVGLHAKLYVVERNRSAHVFIGSANATGAAFGGNVEFLVELVGGATRLGAKRFLDPDGGLGTILEPYSPSGAGAVDPIDEALQMLRNTLRAIAEHRFTSTVTRAGERYEQRVESGAITISDGVDVSVELLTLPGTAAALQAGADFDETLGPVDIDQVTPFLVVHATTAGPSGEELRQATVIRSELRNDPVERLDEILARQVDTPEKFLRFLLLILGITDPAALVDHGVAGSSGSWMANGRSNGIFELLARAVADRPQVLDDLDRLIPRLRATETGVAVLPDGFDKLWETIQQARPALMALRDGQDVS